MDGDSEQRVPPVDCEQLGLGDEHRQEAAREGEAVVRAMDQQAAVLRYVGQWCGHGEQSVMDQSRSWLLKRWTYMLKAAGNSIIAELTSEVVRLAL